MRRLSAPAVALGEHLSTTAGTARVELVGPGYVLARVSGLAMWFEWRRGAWRERS